jgi:hypothetical protein
MMNFRTVNQAIIDTLGAAAAGRFQVVGYQRQVKSAQEVKNSGRMVQSYYAAGDFPKSAGRQTGPTQHNMVFSIGLTVSAPARLDLAAINNPASSAVQVGAALAALQEAADSADLLLDELAEYVYQILMDGRNFDLGLPVGTVSKRWVNSIRKDTPAPEGALVVLTGTVEFSCNTVEDILGDTGTVGGIVSTVLDIDGDAVERTGVETNNP